MFSEKLKASDPVIIKEGGETQEFWKILGGKKEYANHPRLQQDLNETPPRLFGISDSTGTRICPILIVAYFPSFLFKIDIATF